MTPLEAGASSLILTHFNKLSTSQIVSRLRSLRDAYPTKPIVCNEDARTGASAAGAAQTSITNGGSYGLMLERLNQYYPFRFYGRADDAVAYDKYGELSLK